MYVYKERSNADILMFFPCHLFYCSCLVLPKKNQREKKIKSCLLFMHRLFHCLHSFDLSKQINGQNCLVNVGTVSVS